MEAREPLAKEKVVTPTSIAAMQNNFSNLVLMVTSPYPTVVIVVTVK